MRSILGNSGDTSLVYAKNPEDILEVAKGFGSAEMKRDSNGDPIIVGRMQGIKYAVLFYGCDEGEGCSDIQFYAGFSHKVSVEAVNEWNQKKRFGKAYIDGDGDVCIDMSVSMAHGLPRETLDDAFNWWLVALVGLKDHLFKD